MTFDLDHAVQVLARTPPTLRAFLSGLPDVWVSADEGPNTWSVTDNLGHLIHGEDTDWIPRARIILTEGEARPFEPFDRCAQFERFRSKRIPELLDLFEARRQENLATLRGWKLTPARFALTGLHPEFGRVTLEQLLATWVVHDLGHLAQMARVMAKRYVQDVGPWKAYLPVLTR